MCTHLHGWLEAETRAPRLPMFMLTTGVMRGTCIRPEQLKASMEACAVSGGICAI